MSVEIVLGAFIAGCIGIIVHMIYSGLDERFELKRIKISLKNEIEQNIYLIKRNQTNLKSLLGEGDIKRDRTKDEWNNMQEQFNPGSFRLETLLVNAIYSNNSIFKLSVQRLTIIRNIHAVIKGYNDELQGWHDITRKVLDEQFNPNILDNPNTHVPLIMFFSKHTELNIDIKTKLEGLKRLWEQPISPKQFEKSVILAWQKGETTKEYAEKLISDQRLYQIKIIEQKSKKPKIVRID